MSQDFILVPVAQQLRFKCVEVAQTVAITYDVCQQKNSIHTDECKRIL